VEQAHRPQEVSGLQLEALLFHHVHHPQNQRAGRRGKMTFSKSGTLNRKPRLGPLDHHITDLSPQVSHLPMGEHLLHRLGAPVREVLQGDLGHGEEGALGLEM